MKQTDYKLIIVKLGDGYIGICYTSLSTLMKQSGQSITIENNIHEVSSFLLFIQKFTAGKKYFKMYLVSSYLVFIQYYRYILFSFWNLESQKGQNEFLTRRK